MYTLSVMQLAMVLGLQKSSKGDNLRADALERKVQQSLPVIDGLNDAASDSARLAIYSRTIDRQLREFVKTNGSPFGEEIIVCDEEMPRERMLAA